MSDARQRELEAHEGLRRAIRECSLAMLARRAEAGEEDDPEQIVGGVLVDYVVVAAYDDLQGDSTTTAILRTDGMCATYRTLGLLEQGVRDI